MKAILVIDMPSNCIEDCIVNCSQFNAKGTPIPNDCPLRPLPNRMSEITPAIDFTHPLTIHSQGIHDGWNMCLDEILGDCITQEEADCCGVQFWHDD